jgi:predicted glycogen debranching enzyme
MPPRDSSRRGTPRRALRAPADRPSQSRPSKNAAPYASAVSFGPEICGDLEAAEHREWLVTNGIGGFASGTVAGSATRRYHGLLLAALTPPAGRTHLIGALDEVVTVGDAAYELATHRWASGAVAPQGHRLLSRFSLEGTIPAWLYQAGPAQIEKRIWMRHGANTTYVRYTVLDSSEPVSFELKALVNYRDFHSTTHAGSSPYEWQMRVEPVEAGLRITAFDGAAPFYLKSAGASAEVRHTWYRDFFYARERDRGLDDREDLLLAAAFRVTLEKSQSLTLVFSTEAAAGTDGETELAAERDRQSEILRTASSATVSAAAGGQSTESPTWLPQLLLAADQFLASRPLPGQPEGKTVIAGYHWFGDWGRDTMIALPGLALATGRAPVARQILLAFARFVDGGMLPNNFPDAGGGPPQYNTIDATLWYFEAIRQYFQQTSDRAALTELFPVLEAIIAAHVAGTRYNIHVDPADGLLYGGGPGVQLTWMDAKIGDWVVTPRTGKPVEINALWLNALACMKQFARELGRPPENYDALAAQAESSFDRFWNADGNFCFDVIDCPVRQAGENSVANDPALRPNQILAVALPESPLSPERQKAIVDACAAQLLTPFGLRSLAPGEPSYIGAYAGSPRERDAVYHQGTVWGWLLGPFALAHYRVYRDRDAALAFLEPLARATSVYGLGTLAEVFDGDAPHRPGGCIAQAWTVAEVLRALRSLTNG